VFDTTVADMVFLVCAIVGGGLLLITVLLDDILGGLFEFLDFDIGGSSLMPILLAFVAMFGIGGLFGTQVLELSNAGAAMVGVISGVGGAAIAWGMFRFLRSSVTESPFSQEDLIGRDAYVSVSIPRTAWGTISMEVEGQTQEFRATSSVDIERGAMVRIAGVAGNGLIVEPPPQPDAGTAAPAASGQEPDQAAETVEGTAESAGTDD
jgi:membrane protein implicated in regulation of membrane protease activity